MSVAASVPNILLPGRYNLVLGGSRDFEAVRSLRRWFGRCVSG